MIGRPPRSTRTYTLFPYRALFRSVGVGLQLAVGAPLRAAHERLALPHRVGGHLPDVCEGERRRRCDHDSTHRYFTATGLVGAPVPPVTGSGFATRSIRSEERRVGKACVSTCRSRWSPDH